MPLWISHSTECLTPGSRSPCDSQRLRDRHPEGQKWWLGLLYPCHPGRCRRAGLLAAAGSSPGCLWQAFRKSNNKQNTPLSVFSLSAFKIFSLFLKIFRRNRKKFYQWGHSMNKSPKCTNQNQTGPYSNLDLIYHLHSFLLSPVQS